MSTLHEEWRPVVGYEGAYEVSSTGHVRSLARRDSAGRQREGKPLSPAMSNGYRYVLLTRNGVSKPIRIHVLVAEAFIGPRPDGYHVHHKDHDKLNNSVANLEYVTPQKNASLAGAFHREKYWEKHLPSLPAYLARLAERQ